MYLLPLSATNLLVLPIIMPAAPASNVFIAVGFGLNAKFRAIPLIPEAADILILVLFLFF